ncbi:cell surface glycoprotein CD200 receptor 1 [Acomys russatus]|uniref:cell surface glycoprotein CD200 receptor 1 n=1 Tax=Acomys russatus TaxID=60746 RepID=UPI0021E289AB|nr:cell surface glycoprotein CD200 receptor 1 [Acomys russatus]
MLFFWRTSDIAVLLIWGIFVAESSCMNRTQTTENGSLPIAAVNTTLFVQMGEKALLCCPAIPLTEAILIIWTITLRGLPSCRITYKVDTKETNKTNCTDRRVICASISDQSPNLQISAVALEHDGYYSCEIVTPQGNFLGGYDLQVLVPPHLTLFPGEIGTAVCEAIAGKPAAQIFWTPDEDCGTKKESHSNGTVTVRSTCHWEQDNVSAVVCFVSHLTGNYSLSVGLKGDGNRSLRQQYLPYIVSSLVILTIIGCIWLLKISGFRKCKLPKSEAIPAVEEDEMQPYASYTEKSNPLYDTVTKVEALPVL